MLCVVQGETNMYRNFGWRQK